MSAVVNIADARNQVIQNTGAVTADTATIDLARVATLGWLAGIIDGEGSVYTGLRPGHRLVVIVNTDPAILDRARQALDDLGVRCAIYVKKQGQHDWSRRRPCWQLHVKGRAAERLCQIILWYLSPTKRARALHMLATYASHE